MILFCQFINRVQSFINCVQLFINRGNKIVNHAHNLVYYSFLHVMCAAPYLIFVKYVGDKNYENN